MRRTVPFMNTFPRHSRFDGHLIQALPNRYRCAECSGQLSYACGTDTETVICFVHPEHEGLKRVEDVYVPVPEHSEMRELIRIDPTIASIVSVLNRRNINLLYGEE
jgi:hypothetical protein